MTAQRDQLGRELASLEAQPPSDVHPDAVETMLASVPDLSDALIDYDASEVAGGRSRAPTPARCSTSTTTTAMTQTTIGLQPRLAARMELESRAKLRAQLGNGWHLAEFGIALGAFSQGRQLPVPPHLGLERSCRRGTADRGKPSLRRRDASVQHGRRLPELHPGRNRVRDAYGEEKYQRLVALKDRYDPDNLFGMNQNIKPSKAAAEPSLARSGSRPLNASATAAGSAA